MSSCKLFISTPCYDAMMTMQYTISLLNLVQELNKNKIEFVIDFIGNESLIPRARNTSLGKFIKSNFTHLLFIDSDIEFQAEAVIDFIKFDRDVVCGVYAKKGYNWNRLIYSMQTETNSNEKLCSRGLDFNYNVKEKKIIKEGNFIKVKHASTGFMLIKKDIINKLCDNHKELLIKTDNLSNNNNEMYGLFCCMIKNKIYLSEDYSFCERVNDIGGEVWINVFYNLNHIGKHIFQSDIKNRQNILRSSQEKILYN